MKKTLIALAVAASAAVSGSAMAWDPNGTGGTMVFGGTLTPATETLPWETMVGKAINLNAEVKAGVRNVDIPVNAPIPVLGIRTKTSEPFNAAPGITPQIDYGSAVDLQRFENSVTTLTLNVNGADGQKIGTMSAPFFAAAEVSNGADMAFGLYASDEGYAFNGGLPLSSAQTGDPLDTTPRVSKLNADFVAHYDKQGADTPEALSIQTDFSDGLSFSAFYGAGIETGNNITINFDNPVNGQVDWTASMPITVSYQ